MVDHTSRVIALLGTKQPDMQIPFKRITNREALELLNAMDHEISFGQNVSKGAEELLTNHFGESVWITHNPGTLEPFPYCVCPADKELSITAD